MGQWTGCISICDTQNIKGYCQQVKTWLSKQCVKNIYLLLKKSKNSNITLTPQDISILINIILVLVRFCIRIFQILNINHSDFQYFISPQSHLSQTLKNKNANQSSIKNILREQDIKKTYSANQKNRNTITQLGQKNIKPQNNSMIIQKRMNSSQIEMSQRSVNKNNQLNTSPNNQKLSSNQNSNKLIDEGQARYKTQIQHWIRQNNRLKNEISELELSNKQLKSQIQSINNNKSIGKDKEIIINQRQIQVNVLNRQNQLNNPQILIQDLQMKLKTQISKNKQLNNLVQNLNKDTKNIKNEKQTLTRQLITQRSLNNSLKTQIDSLQIQIISLTQKNTILDKQNKKANQTITQLNVNILKIQRLKSDLFEKIKQQNHRKINQTQQKIKILQKNKYQQQISQLTNRFNHQNRQKQEILSQMTLQIQNKQKQIQQLIKRQKQIISNLNRQKQLQQNKNKKQQPIQRCYMQYFNGYIFEKQNDQLIWFVTTLQRQTQKRVKKTNFLYRMDFQNTVSLHSYIDGHPNIMLVAKLMNGNIVAGFSSAPFKKDSKCDFEQGYIFSLTEKKVFSLKRELINGKIPPTPVVYDDYFIIYGSSQLRIRLGQAIIYSNFATNTGFFDNKGQPISTLLNNKTNRDAQLETYQLYQVIWQ